MHSALGKEHKRRGILNKCESINHGAIVCGGKTMPSAGSDGASLMLGKQDNDTTIASCPPANSDRVGECRLSLTADSLIASCVLDFNTMLLSPVGFQLKLLLAQKQFFQVKVVVL